MTLFFDVTRTVGRIGRSTPVGIDRVEYAYARELFLERDPADTFGVLTTPWFAGAIEGARVRGILKSVEAAWGNKAGPAADPIFAKLKAWLAGPLDMAAPRPAHFIGVKKSRLKLADLGRLPLLELPGAARRLRNAAAAAGARGAYLHVSHLMLDRAGAFDWAKAAGVRSAFMLHDAIPNEFPEFCRPGRDATHLRRILNAAKSASNLLTISEDSAASITALLRANGVAPPPMAVNPPGVDPWFLEPAALDPPKPGAPYFVCVGTIEPRKNLAFLLLVWRRLAERLGAGAPRLVIVGRRGWENENIIDLLERSRRLGPFVAEVADLTDAGLASLLAGASALLAPSLAEGFGLPLAEALALGTPVIANDIPAHREVGGPFASYAEGVDGLGWTREIIGAAAVPVGARSLRAAGHQPTSWRAHVARTLEILAGRPPAR